MPRALLSRGQKNLLPKRYSILTIALSDSHHGVTRYPRATVNKWLVSRYFSLLFSSLVGIILNDNLSIPCLFSRVFVGRALGKP